MKKSKVKCLLEKSIVAMVSAVEIYNKPNFLYRGETFSILAINAWELLFKSRYLELMNSKLNKLYVYENKIKKDGSKSKKKQVKKTRSGNPYTHSLEFVAKKLLEMRELDEVVVKNIAVLTELRDSSIHFFNVSVDFNARLQEIGTATLRNYVLLQKKWFSNDLLQFNFYLMPLSFLSFPDESKMIIMNKEEKNYMKYLNLIDESINHTESEYSIRLNLDVSFSKANSLDAVNFAHSNEPDAIKVNITEEQVRERYSIDYTKLTEICNNRYSDFKANRKYHEIRKKYGKFKKYAHTFVLDPANTRSPKKTFYNNMIINALDEHYTRKQV